MPLVHSSHARLPELEHELAELWRAIDGLRKLVDWILLRLDAIETNLGIEPPDPPDDGSVPHEWPE